LIEVGVPIDKEEARPRLEGTASGGMPQAEQAAEHNAAVARKDQRDLTIHDDSGHGESHRFRGRAEAQAIEDPRLWIPDCIVGGSRWDEAGVTGSQAPYQAGAPECRGQALDSRRSQPKVGGVVDNSEGGH
jgi:hypothetical protein